MSAHKNELEVKEEKLGQILREFPMLWAIESTWCPQHDRVHIRKAEEKLFAGKWSGRKVWILTRDMYSREMDVNEIMHHDSSLTLGHVIHETMTMHKKTLLLELLVVRDSVEQAWPKGISIPASPAQRKFFKEYSVYKDRNSFDTLQQLLEAYLRDSQLTGIKV